MICTISARAHSTQQKLMMNWPAVAASLAARPRDRHSARAPHRRNNVIKMLMQINSLRKGILSDCVCVRRACACTAFVFLRGACQVRTKQVHFDKNHRPQRPQRACNMHNIIHLSRVTAACVCACALYVCDCGTGNLSARVRACLSTTNFYFALVEDEEYKNMFSVWNNVRRVCLCLEVRT